jgi:hypothetical protein
LAWAAGGGRGRPRPFATQLGLSWHHHNQPQIIPCSLGFAGPTLDSLHRHSNAMHTHRKKTGGVRRLLDQKRSERYSSAHPPPKYTQNRPHIGLQLVPMADQPATVRPRCLYHGVRHSPASPTSVWDGIAAEPEPASMPNAAPPPRAAAVSVHCVFGRGHWPGVKISGGWTK